jgi:hypothetical protein
VNLVDPSGESLVGDAWNVVNAPFDAATGAINYVADQTGLTDAANNALVYWSNLAFDPNSSSFALAAGWAGGLLSSLAACDNIGDTTVVLGSAGLGGAAKDAWDIGRAGKDTFVSRGRVPTGGRKWRISLTGHRPDPTATKAPHWGRNLPHYHRRPGIGKHRPWEGGF